MLYYDIDGEAITAPKIINARATNDLKNGELQSGQRVIIKYKLANGRNRYKSPQSIDSWKAMIINLML